MSDFADWLNELVDREYPGWTYEAICADLDKRGVHVTRATLSRYLNGHSPSERTRRRWYSKLGGPDKQKSPGIAAGAEEVLAELRELRGEIALIGAQARGERRGVLDVLADLGRRLERIEAAANSGGAPRARPPRQRPQAQ